MPKGNPVFDGIFKRAKRKHFSIGSQAQAVLVESKELAIVFGCVALNGKQKEAFRWFIRGTNGNFLFLLVQPKYVPTQGSQTTNSHPVNGHFNIVFVLSSGVCNSLPGFSHLGRPVNKELGPFWANHHEAKPK